MQVPDTPPLRDFLHEKGIPFFHGYGRLTVFGGGEIFEALESRVAGEEMVRRRPNLEDLFVKLTGRMKDPQTGMNAVGVNIRTETRLGAKKP